MSEQRLLSSEQMGMTSWKAIARNWAREDLELWSSTVECMLQGVVLDCLGLSPNWIKSVGVGLTAKPEFIGSSRN